MDNEKVERLRSKGWAVEKDPRQLLGLTDEEMEFIKIKTKLARELKKLRLRRGLTQKEVAVILNSSQSRVAKMEQAQSSVTIDLLMRALIGLGESRRDISKVIYDDLHEQPAI